MGHSRNVNGTAYALTVFTAILPGHEPAVRDTIENLPRGDASPIARLRRVHTSRLQIFDQPVYQGAPQKPDRLESAYLVFTAAFDGDFDSFVDAIVDHVKEADSWWRHCVGYPGLSDRAAFKRWIRHNQIDTDYFVIASPNESVIAVREALSIRERVLRFAIETQGLEASEVQERFRRAFGGVAESAR